MKKSFSKSLHKPKSYFCARILKFSIMVICLYAISQIHAKPFDGQIQQGNVIQGLRLVCETVGDSSLSHVKTIRGRISPKSIVHNGNGVFFAQNMMYRHTITVYDRAMNLINTISDKVRLSDFGLETFRNEYRGAPVECTFTHNGNYAWVSNYNMTGGSDFSNPGCDNCFERNKYDESFVYRVNSNTFQIEAVVKVGAVPKYLASTHDSQKVLVSNWSSGDVSIINTNTNLEEAKIYVGRFPRGIVVDAADRTAYVAVMGSKNIAAIDLISYEVKWIENVGTSPRHLCLSPEENFLFASLNGEGTIARIGLQSFGIQKVRTGSMPRSMVLSEKGEYLYVVNYGDNTVAKVRTDEMTVVDVVKTENNPIGVTIDNEERSIWVCCYSGCIMKFSDLSLTPPTKVISSNFHRIPDRFLLADANMDGKLTADEVHEVIDNFLDGEELFEIQNVYQLLDYYLE